MREIKRNLGTHDDYTPLALLRYNSRAEIEAEYKRMRKNLKKNVNTIKKSGEFENAQIIKAVEDFEAPSNYDDRELASQLSRLESLLSSNTATLTGLRIQRQDTIETLQDRGYTAINASNFADFTKFMESTRALTLAILRYSYNRYGQAQGEDRNKRLELFNIAQKKGFTTTALIRDFKFFVNHIDEIKQLPDRPTGRKMGARTIRKRLKEI